jgi:hypothetical protein
MEYEPSLLSTTATSNLLQRTQVTLFLTPTDIMYYDVVIRNSKTFKPCMTPLLKHKQTPLLTCTFTHMYTPILTNTHTHSQRCCPMYTETTKHNPFLPSEQPQFIGARTLHQCRKLPQGCWPMLTPMLPTVVSSWLNVHWVMDHS